MEFRNELDELYSKVEPDPHRTYLYLQWFGNYIRLEELIRVGEYVLDTCEKNGITRLINDNTGLEGSWDHVNDWNVNVWLPRALGIGIKKLAHITSPEIFAQLSAQEMQQLFEGKLETRSFSNFADAEAWVKSGD